MKELIKTLRWIHFSLILVSSAALILALSSNRALQYRRSLAQLDTLSRLSLDNYSGACNKAIQRIETQDAREVKETLLQHFGVQSEDSLQIIYPYYCSWPESNASISQIADFFVADNEVRYLAPRDNITTDDVSGIVAEHLKEKPVGTELSHIFVDRPKSMQYRHFPNAAILDHAPGDDDQDGTFNLGTRKPKDSDSGEWQETISVPIKMVKSRGRLAIDWLENDERASYSKLFTDGVFLGDVKPFWNEVASLTPVQALRELSDKPSSAIRTLKFLGLEIDEDTSVWAAPLLVATLLLFFLTHLVNFCQLPELQQLRPTDLQWLGIMPGALSVALVSASILVLPVAGLILLIARTREVNLAAAIGITLTGLSLVLEIVCLRRLREIRRKIQKPRNHTTTADSTDFPIGPA
jgi:hypothetical protein